MRCGGWDAAGVVVLVPMRMKRRASRRPEVRPRDRRVHGAIGAEDNVHVPDVLGYGTVCVFSVM